MTDTNPEEIIKKVVFENLDDDFKDLALKYTKQWN